MPSKFDLIRQGHAVQIEPGLSGKLNKENKTLELSSGEVLNVGHNKNFFPSNEQDVKLSKQREYAEKSAKGGGGEFFHQYTSEGIPGSISDIGAYLTQNGEEYATRKQAQNQVSERISEESPYISGAATGANIATDIALTRGMSALKAAPLLTAGSAGSRIFTEPGEVLKDSLIAAGGGYILDKTTGGLSKNAARRGEARALPAQRQAVNEANALQNQEFNALRQNIKDINESKLIKHQEDLNTRQNAIIQEQNAYEQRKLLRDNEIIRLKNKYNMDKTQRAKTTAQSEIDYKMAKEAAEQENKRMAEQFKQQQLEYQQALKELPELEKKAQQEYSANVVKNAERIANSFPEKSRIYSSQFGVNNFIEESIQKSGLAGTKSANQSSKILKTLFPEGEILTSKELASRYKSLEEAIQKATPEVKQVLNDFKVHLGERLPNILADHMAYSRVVPLLKKQIEKDVISILNEMPLAESGISSRPYLKNQANYQLNQIFRELSPEYFLQKMQNGEIREKILNNILHPHNFSEGVKNAIKKGRKIDIISESEFEKLGITSSNFVQPKYNQFRNALITKLDKELAKAEMKMIAVDIDASKRLGAKVKRTYGMAESVAPPVSPQAPTPIAYPVPPAPLPDVPPIQIPSPVAPPVHFPTPAKPSLMPEPIAPIPQAMPTLPPAQGMAERIGDFLERPILGGEKGINPLLKLGGLKYLLGKAALPAEAAYLGMKGLTSPTAAGKIARMSFKQAGIKAIDMWAQNYPSYRNGILENPQDRRSLTKEIENDFEIPIEQKAVLQSKINRGKPLQERL